MNITVFSITVGAGFIGGIFSVKQVTESRKWTLFIVFFILGIVLGWIIPPQFNEWFLITAVSFQGGSIVSRYLSYLPEKARMWYSVRKVMREYGQTA